MPVTWPDLGRSESLPPRIGEAIGREQEKSERLIGWIQLCVVTLFGVLYTMSPKTYPADVAFRPVPWAIGLYLAFTAARLWLAYRRPLPGWLVGLSVVADIALLLVTIWSFHLQYAQPASFYLKAPTVMYVFIFIALRALRFEVRYVLLAGASAALGWLAMVAWVVWSDPSNPMITRDYVIYLTSNSVLIGAEFDKVVTIVMVTGVLALVLARARRLLVRSVTEAAATRSLSRFFSPAVARRIASADSEVRPGHGVVRDIAVLMLDLRGFTALSRELSADETIALLTNYQSRVVPVIRDNGGVVDKFQGDGILATFGAVEANPTFAADALRTVAAVVAAMAEWNRERRRTGLPELRVGGAVASGRAVFGIIGDAERLEYTVIGSPVNLAAKLEKHNKAEGAVALTDVATYRLALAQGLAADPHHEERPGRSVEGWAEPLDLVILAGSGG